MSFDQITAIVRARYELGEYGFTHFSMTTEVIDHLNWHHAAPKPKYPWQLELPPELGGIPIVADDALPQNTWRLVHNHTGEVLHEGTIDRSEDGTRGASA